MAIDGATIEIRQGGLLIETLTTDINGRADTQLPAGNYDVTISKTGYVTTNYTLVIINEETHATFDLQSPPTPATASAAVETPFTEESSVESATMVVETTLAESGSANLKSSVPEAPSAETAMTDTGAAAVNTTTWHLTMILASVDGADPLGTLSPGASANPAAGATQAINLTESQYWAFVSWFGNEGIGTQTTQAYTIPAKTAGKQVVVFCNVSHGWEITVTGSTTDETDQIQANGASKVYTRSHTPVSPEVFDGWFLDEVYKSSATTYQAPAQTSGTSHQLQARFHTP